MSQFRTQFSTPNFPFQLDHKEQILSLGSCFAENIGARLEALKFPVCRNPFGILYNPISILNALDLLYTQHQFTAQDLFQYNELWHSFRHHSQFSSLDQATTLATIQESATQASERLHSCNRLFLTFGTAYVYQHLESQQIVANCHKLPASNFLKKRLSVSEIVEAYTPFLKELKANQTALEVVLTVSPIRHIKDGIIENQRSKATLLLAIDELCKALDFVHYFPAYELLIDDLRDYRFYAEDMIHPSKVAIDYVWKVFCQSVFSAQTLLLNKQLEKLQSGLAHRPFQVESAAHQVFLNKLLGKIQQFQKAYPALNFEEEKRILEKQRID